MTYDIPIVFDELAAAVAVSDALIGQLARAGITVTNVNVSAGRGYSPVTLWVPDRSLDKAAAVLGFLAPTPIRPDKPWRGAGTDRCFRLTTGMLMSVFVHGDL